MTELNDFEMAVILTAMVASAFVMLVALFFCMYMDRRTEQRIWQNKRDLSRIDML